MSSKSRLTWCSLLCLTPFIPITVRLVRLQVLEHRKLSSLVSGELNLESLEIAPRGRILDRLGNILAESLPSWSSFLDPSELRNPAATAQKLSQALRMNRSEIFGKAKSRGKFAWLKRKMTPAEMEALKSLHLEGVGIVPDEQRFYPNGDMARGLLGMVGTDNKGLSGMERAYDKDLTGSAQKLRLIRDGFGRHALLADNERPPSPSNLVLTLDQNIQQFAQAALAEGVAQHKPKLALALVQDVRTGEILAAASYPEDPLKNIFIQYSYEPGSTYKLVTMAGVLEEHIASPSDILSGEGGRWEISPRVFVKDHEPIETMTVAEALEKSSNIGLAKLGLRLGPDKFYAYSRAFGIGTKTGLSLSGESSGKIFPPNEVNRVRLANNSFGQGLVTTPLQILEAYSAIANGGMLLEPKLVLGIGNRKTSDSPAIRRVASEKTVKILVQMLRGVVERGTGLTAAVPGFSVAGKTGTAQKVDPMTGHYSTTEYVASFVGFAPVQDPRFTILVLMDSPKNSYYGADVAAPVFSKLMGRLLTLEGIVPDQPLAARTPAPAAPPHATRSQTHVVAPHSLPQPSVRFQ